jgi:hypothetical protein
MAENHMKTALTAKQQIKLPEKFDNRECVTELPKIMGQGLSDCICKTMLPH